MSRIVFTPVSGSLFHTTRRIVTLSGTANVMWVLVPHDEADRDLERHGERHAALLALLDVVLELHLHGRPAQIAHVAAGVVGAAAGRADHGALAVRIGHEHGAAPLALRAQVLETLQPAALALPVPDGVLDELQRRV